MKEFDTICGIATPLGEGGISIIRVTQSAAEPVAEPVQEAPAAADEAAEAAPAEEAKV